MPNLFLPRVPSLHNVSAKKRIALVGTGVRGLGMWGKPVIRDYKEFIQFVGLCDINPGRVQTGKEMLGVDCATYTDIDKMLKETKPELLLVMSVDGVHHEHIIKASKQVLMLLRKNR